MAGKIFDVNIPVAGEWWAWVRVVKPNDSNSFRSHGFWLQGDSEYEV